MPEIPTSPGVNVFITVVVVGPEVSSLSMLVASPSVSPERGMGALGVAILETIIFLYSCFLDPHLLVVVNGLPSFGPTPNPGSTASRGSLGGWLSPRMRRVIAANDAFACVHFEREVNVQTLPAHASRLLADCTHIARAFLTHQTAHALLTDQYAHTLRTHSSRTVHILPTWFIRCSHTMGILLAR